MSVNHEFILGLNNQNLSKDNDLTLGEYLEKYQQVNTKIESENLAVKDRKSSSSIEKLVGLLEDLDEDNLAEEIEELETGKEEAMTFKNKIDRKNNKNLFSTNNKVRQSPTSRKSNYANTRLFITNESRLAPLKLKQFQSE